MKKIISFTILFSSSVSMAVTPYYRIRSQSENAARELVGAGWNTQINLCNMEKCYGNFSITPEYTQSFRSEQICNCLFGCFANCYNPCNPCCNPCKLSPQYGKYSVPYCTSSCMQRSDSCCEDSGCFINISGSHVENRGSRDLLADYFGLPTDYKSIVCFKPEISNFIVDFNFYLGFDEWVQGLYVKIHAPLVCTWWDLNMCECTIDDGNNDHWPGYFNGNLEGTEPNLFGIKRLHLVPSFTSFISGCDFINTNDITFNSLNSAKMACNARKKTALADVRTTLGWNFLCNENYHVGINLQAAAPTGNRPEGCYLFEPIVGNGKHWEIGCGINAHWNFWGNRDDESYCELHADANITYLMGAKQIRTFDLCGKPLSRYMLAAKFGSPVTDLKAEPENSSLEPPNKQFQGIYTPVANITTIAVDVSVSVQADIVLMLQYVNSNCSFDIGYNFWGRSCEKIELRCDCPCPFEEGTWGLKGDAFMYGFKSLDGSITTTAVPLSATQSRATICQGTNKWPNGFDGIAWPQNPGIDSRQLAWDDNKNPLLIYDVANTTTCQIYTSNNPTLIKFCDIDITGAGTKGISHKVFAHFDYTWREREEWVPYIGLGGEVEFGYQDKRCNSCSNSCYRSCSSCCVPPCSATCDSSRCCNSCALSQWGIWLKGGVAFH
ncbi:hypothetical protein E3J79_00365 [Candidatus Dependentiae bacterium]|nr:MAG: hypothetical protein E3J79_00365 [Candidatus Dependentiae bacterium]